LKNEVFHFVCDFRLAIQHPFAELLDGLYVWGEYDAAVTEQSGSVSL